MGSFLLLALLSIYQHSNVNAQSSLSSSVTGIDNCSLIYNVTDPTSISQIITDGDYESDFCDNNDPSGDGYCDCDDSYYSSILEDNGDYFQLSGDGSLEYYVTFTKTSGQSLLDAYYTISSFRQYVEWGDANWGCVMTLIDYNGNTYSQNISQDSYGGNTFFGFTTNSAAIVEKIYVYLNFSGGSQNVEVSGWSILGTEATRAPTRDPTIEPTNEPTESPTKDPTMVPTTDPTKDPTTQPTMMPTDAPTWYTITAMTNRTEDNSYQWWSDNIYPLSDRDGYLTSANYTLPDKELASGEIKDGEDRAFCVFCILAWADIDASIELEGCDGYDKNSYDPWDENSIYHCDDGEWILKSSAALADWQDTYGRVEIWEVDDNGLKWEQWYFEFQWKDRTCYINNTDTGEGELCPLLPLTSDDDYGAYIEWSMPKKYGDVRKAPLIVVWYDLLNIPYSLRPHMDYNYTNFTWSYENSGDTLTFADFWDTFEPAVICAAVLFGCFVCVIILSAFVAPNRKKRKDYMLDTRNLRSTFRHTPDTIICPAEHIIARNRFSCARHGPWLLVVLVARLMYMFIFTFTFMWITLKAINQDSWNTLTDYEVFSEQRNDQIVEMAENVETAYSNETDRMETEYQFREYWCYDYYVNHTLQRYTYGAKTQAAYHDEQMDNPFGDYTFNWTLSDELYVQGDGTSGCSVDTSDGAIIWVSKSQSIYYTVDDPDDCPTTWTPPTSEPTAAPTTSGTPEPTPEPSKPPTVTGGTTPPTREPTPAPTVYNGTITWSCKLDATHYLTTWPNFTSFEAIITPYCESESWCKGWGFYDGANGLSNGSYYIMFSELADTPTDSTTTGKCYGTSDDSDLEFLKWNSTYFENYAEIQTEEYLSDYQSYAEDLYDSLQGLWSAVQDIDTEALSQSEGTGAFNDPYIVGSWGATENLSSSANYEIDIDLSNWLIDLGCLGNNADDCGDSSITYEADIVVGCPDCPAGNFTEEFLQFVDDYFSNGSNLSDLFNDTSVNLSSLVSFSTSLVEFPEFPSINVPFDINININLSFLGWTFVTLDILLFAYRWYKTIGIVARIIRGKEVDVHLHKLMVLHRDLDFCDGTTVLDTLLNAIMWCNDKLNKFSYNCWKVFYWIWLLLKIAIAGLIVAMMYLLVSTIVNPDFINDMGLYYFMTAGIRVQRSVRNEVLCVSALSYNNYTLANLESTIDTQRQDWNDDAWEFNEDELARVDEYNALFCQGWSAYLQTTKDVTTQSEYGEFKDYTAADSSDQSSYEETGTYFEYDVDVSTGVDYLFDSDSSTYWSPLDTDDSTTGDVTFDFTLSEIWTSSETTSGWNLEQITLDWRFNFSNETKPISNTTAVEYEIFYRNSTNESSPDYAWTLITGIASAYEPETGGTPEARISTASSVSTLSVGAATDTLNVRIVFKDIEKWGVEQFLNGIAFAGFAAEVDCPEVKFGYWDFEAAPTTDADSEFYNETDSDGTVTFYDNKGTYVEMCPQITPIHGIMHRGFVGSWLEQELEDAHTPFIEAAGSIAVSPFYIMLGLIVILFIAYLFAMIMEFFLMKLDLYRENPYARVPLVVTDWDDYDAENHETGGPTLEHRSSQYGMATAGMNYVSSKNLFSESLVPKDITHRGDIEMEMAKQDPITNTNGTENEGGPYAPPQVPSELMRRESRGDTVFEY